MFPRLREIYAYLIDRSRPMYKQQQHFKCFIALSAYYIALTTKSHPVHKKIKTYNADAFGNGNGTVNRIVDVD